MGKKTPKAPAAPDYSALATQQAEIDRKAHQVNQTNAQGDTLRYTQNPDGTTNQTQTLNAADQARLDQSRGMYGGLMDKMGANYTKGFDSSGMQDVNFNGMDPTGNNKEVQDATYALLKPQLDKRREDSMLEMRNRGFNDNTEGWGRRQNTLDQGENDAMLKSLLAGRQDYGDSFNRNLQMQQGNLNDRNQEYGERMDEYNRPAQDLSTILRMQPGNPQFGNVATAPGADIMGAADKTYAAQMNEYNAAQKAKGGGLLGSLGGIAGTALGSMAGPLGASLGGSLGKGLFSGGGGGSGSFVPSYSTKGMDPSSYTWN